MIIDDSNLFFIVEEGMANMGNKEVAFRMIEVTKDTGADAIEFQFYLTDEFCAPYDNNYSLYRNWQLSIEDMCSIIKCAKDADLLVSVALLSPSLANPLIETGCSFFNINASDLTNPDIIDVVCKSGKPFFLSNLISTQEEIEWAINRINKNNATDFCLLHGQHTMFGKIGGHDYDQTELGCLKSFSKKYSIPVGFIDHTSSLWMPSCAVAAGASIISKHLIIDRSLKGPDWHICLEPTEMRQSINDARKIFKSLKIDEKKMIPSDKDRTTMRKSIVAARDLIRGDVIQKKDIQFKRPGNGIAPLDFENIIGKKVIKEIKLNQQIFEMDIE